MKKLLSILAFIIFASVGIGAVAVSDTKISQATSASPVAWKDVVIAPNANTLIGWDNSKVASGVAIGTSLSLASGTVNTIQGIRTTDSPSFVAVTANTSGAHNGTVGATTPTTGAFTTGTFSGNLTAPDYLLGTSGPSVKSSLAARAPAQGLVFDGTPGATTSITTGTTFTLGCVVTPRAFHASLSFLFDGSGGSGAPAIYVNLAGEIHITDGTTVDIATTVNLPLGKPTRVDYTKTGTVGKLYTNGVLAATVVDAGIYNGNIVRVGGGAVGNYFEGSISGIIVENRALSAAEVLAMFEQGAPAAADYNNASNTVLNSDAVVNATAPNAFDSGTFTQVNSFTGVKASGTGRAFFYLSGKSFSVGETFRVRGTLARNSGKVIFPTVSLTDASTGATTLGTGAVLAADGAFDVSVVCTTARSSAFGCSVSFSTSGDANITVTGIVVDKPGLLLAPESNAPGNGYQWKDMSGNKADITLPVSGVDWALPDVRTNQLRASLTWANTHAAQTVGILPANAVITSIVTTASATDPGGGLTVGSVTTPALYVSAVAYTTAKQVQALAAVFPAGTATNDITTVLDPGTSNYTGTIQVAINYFLAQ